LVRKTKLETEQKNNKENLVEVSKRIESIIESFRDSKLNKYYITLEMAEENIAELVKLEEYESQISKFEDAKKIIVNIIEKLEEELQDIEQPDLEEEHQKLQNIDFTKLNIFVSEPSYTNEYPSSLLALNMNEDTYYFDLIFIYDKQNKKWLIFDLKEKE